MKEEVAKYGKARQDVTVLTHQLEETSCDLHKEQDSLKEALEVEVMLKKQLEEEDELLKTIS